MAEQLEELKVFEGKTIKPAAVSTVQNRTQTSLDAGKALRRGGPPLFDQIDVTTN